MKTAMTVSILIAFLAGAVFAEGYQIRSYSINAGGGAIGGGSFEIKSSIGQVSAGFTNNTNFLHWVGFWGGDVPTPTVVYSIAAAKSYPDGTFVSICGKVSTHATSEISATSTSRSPTAMAASGLPCLAPRLRT